MAEKTKFKPQTFDINKINSGNRYGLEGIQPEAINAPIEAAAYVQALVTNPIDVSDADNVGYPSVTIQQTANGTPQLKFSNLKGERGEQGGAEVVSFVAEPEGEETNLKNLFSTWDTGAIYEIKILIPPTVYGTDFPRGIVFLPYGINMGYAHFFCMCEDEYDEYLKFFGRINILAQDGGELSNVYICGNPQEDVTVALYNNSGEELQAEIFIIRVKL